MLYLNLLRVCNEKGIAKPSTYFKKMGFWSATIHKLMTTQSVRVSYDQLEKLCISLNCTPNDLICWKPDTENPLPATHSLHKLHRDAKATVTHQLQQLSMDEIEKVQAFLKQMKEPKTTQNE